MTDRRPDASGDAHGPPGPGFPFGTPFDAAASDDALLDAVGTLPAEQPAPDGALETDMTLWAVVFAGGIGSRFWPLSTPERPKQLLALVGDRPLIAESVGRLAPAIPPERVLVLTSADIADALHAAIPDVPAANMLIEPRPMGTAAALAWGAQTIADRVGRRATFVAMHADLAVGYPDELRRVLKRAAVLASTEHALVAVGAQPTRPETGFGYLLPRPDPAPPRDGPRPVARFVEKPGAILAEELIAQGALWNTGIVVAQAGHVLEALEERTPELSPGLAALAAGKLDRFSGLIQAVSIERGLLERSDDLQMLPADFGWDDVGTWASLRRVRELDDTGNGVWGPAHLVDASSCVVHADGGTTVVLYGLSGMLVVARPGLTFVTSLDRAAELNPLLNALPDELANRTRKDPLQ
ncbi:sugar phosphate nucleotidyltransferase [Roseisolibacter sp. H3M3-2]|uniref:mannose-1-phosphate guanylyltransferase n=1 Tax=Roseisolibacter sp. H3M3-2 TaxID=3031323 RepID=UPI0023DC9CAC|nr:sugar phosphate nucleotidyltransferase [Roseisolibacter sp. H3M3-2]MDF1501547.1 sugar phosphate nucleotidyltransferase [Roseisolibacter sp. H3M3-2]